ncbi:hypothetical protein EVAR_30585_1 [Eumeta japonica]|uniref:Uncharacterized protein n=1 Tax=Eumeta variegata TaxID=151549 RepID=A0A4C1VN35_EUMVA|nr:hypothetical protein EVAR_30585_1 [Eumeta japonica]
MSNVARSHGEGKETDKTCFHQNLQRQRLQRGRFRDVSRLAACKTWLGTLLGETPARRYNDVFISTTVCNEYARPCRHVGVRMLRTMRPNALRAKVHRGDSAPGARRRPCCAPASRPPSATSRFTSLERNHFYSVFDLLSEQCGARAARERFEYLTSSENIPAPRPKPAPPFRSLVVYVCSASFWFVESKLEKRETQ